MFINEYGDKNDPHVLLLALMMVSGEEYKTLKSFLLDEGYREIEMV